MPNINLKQKIIAAIAIIGAILILIFQRGIYNKSDSNDLKEIKGNQQQTQEPEVVSTNPSPLDQATILPTQTIEITFNLPLENVGEFKNVIDPKPDYKIELSSDRKTAKIVPTKPFKVGFTYSLTIKPDTKFDGKKTLNRDLLFHFKTIDYNGV